MSKIMQAIAISFATLAVIPLFSSNANAAKFLEADGTDIRFDSRHLIKAGERAKAFVMQTIEVLSAEEQTNFGTRLEIIDARDPRLYGNGQPIQPPFPAELALVRVSNDGRMRVLSLILDRPGYLAFKMYPTGGFIFSISTSVEFLSYDGQREGTFASVGRSTSGHGWIHTPYVRGLGNEVSSAQFDAAVTDFLTHYVNVAARR